MQTKTTIGALLAVAMLATGCGGGDISVNEQSNLATRADAARPYSYETVYYSGPDLAYMVGATYYPCEGKAVTYGEVTPYTAMEFVGDC